MHKSHPNKNVKQDNWQKQYYAKNGKKHHIAPLLKLAIKKINISPLLINPFPYWHYSIPDISNLILLQVKKKTDNIYEKM